MKRKLTQSQHLKILFGLEVILLVFVGAMFVFFQTKFVRLENQQKQTEAQFSEVREHLAQDSPDQLRRHLLLLEDTLDENFFLS